MYIVFVRATDIVWASVLVALANLASRPAGPGTAERAHYPRFFKSGRPYTIDLPQTCLVNLEPARTSSRHSSKTAQHAHSMAQDSDMTQRWPNIAPTFVLLLGWSPLNHFKSRWCCSRLLARFASSAFSCVGCRPGTLHCLLLLLLFLFPEVYSDKIFRSSFNGVQVELKVSLHRCGRCDPVGQKGDSLKTGARTTGAFGCWMMLGVSFLEANFVAADVLGNCCGLIFPLWAPIWTFVESPDFPCAGVQIAIRIHLAVPQNKQNPTFQMSWTLATGKCMRSRRASRLPVEFGFKSLLRTRLDPCDCLRTVCGTEQARRQASKQSLDFQATWGSFSWFIQIGLRTTLHRAPIMWSTTSTPEKTGLAWHSSLVDWIDELGIDLDWLVWLWVPRGTKNTLLVKGEINQNMSFTFWPTAGCSPLNQEYMIKHQECCVLSTKSFRTKSVG